MIIRVTPDKEKVRSLLGLIAEREQFATLIDHQKFPTPATENYYEIIKELATALLLLEGFKAIGEHAHKDLIEALLRYQEFSEPDIVFLNDLRVKRNYSSYEGKKIDASYLRNHKGKILEIGERLKTMIKRRL